MKLFVLFSFPDLERIRLAFEMYEDFDQRGMQLDIPTIIKALKLCDRVVAPLKLSKKVCGFVYFRFGRNAGRNATFGRKNQLVAR